MVQDEARVDRETLIQIANALGIVLPRSELDRSGQTLDLTVGESLPEILPPPAVLRGGRGGADLVCSSRRAALRALSAPRLVR